MRDEFLPLFPLPLVLFPRTPLPLHIFEERYKEMIGEAISGQTEFGIVLTREEGIVNTGCTALVHKVVHRYPDGRLDVVTVGRRRFEVLELVEGKSYLRAKVLFFDDDEFAAVPYELKQRAMEGYSYARKATGQEPPEEPEWEDPQLSFQLAQILNDLDFRQQLLTLRSESQRLKELAAYFPVHVVRFRHTEHVREVAPLNGYSKITPASED